MNNPRWISPYIFFEKLSIRFLGRFLLPHRYIIHLVRIILSKTWRKPIFIICLRYDPEKKDVSTGNLSKTNHPVLSPFLW